MDLGTVLTNVFLAAIVIFWIHITYWLLEPLLYNLFKKIIVTKKLLHEMRAKLQDDYSDEYWADPGFCVEYRKLYAEYRSLVNLAKRNYKGLPTGDPQWDEFEMERPQHA